jgi:hypothetical protein
MTAGRANVSLNYEERFVRAVARDVAEYQQDDFDFFAKNDECELYPSTCKNSLMTVTERKKLMMPLLLSVLERSTLRSRESHEGKSRFAKS